MSETRDRPSRMDSERWQRRRRQPGSLDRMVTSNLGIPEECKDPEYHYHWINNVRGMPQALNMQDDYEYVTFDELLENARRKRADFTLNRDAYGGGSHIERLVERDGTKAVLMKKPKDMYEYDYEEAIAGRQAMMEARVYGGELDMEAGGRSEDLQNAYVPRGNTLGDTVPRRRGRIPNRLK